MDPQDSRTEEEGGEGETGILEKKIFSPYSKYRASLRTKSASTQNSAKLLHTCFLPSAAGCKPGERGYTTNTPLRRLSFGALPSTLSKRKLRIFHSSNYKAGKLSFEEEAYVAPVYVLQGVCSRLLHVEGRIWVTNFSLSSRITFGKLPPLLFLSLSVYVPAHARTLKETE